MFEGRFYIDGKDAYSNFGIVVAEGSYKNLISWAKLKDVRENDWHEEDGVRPDLDAPKLDTREFSISFNFISPLCRFADFVLSLSDYSYHTFNFSDIGRTYRLRLVKHSSHDALYSWREASLTFADDFPLSNYTYIAPSSTIASYNDAAIDDTLFTEYGIRLTEGTFANVEKVPDVKTNLLRNLPYNSGADYNNSAVRYKQKDVQLKCLMRAASLTELWRNYDAMLYNLTKAGERKLYFFANEEEYPCFYKSQSVDCFFPTGKIWLEFTITLEFTRFRPSESAYLLASEDNILIITEQNDNAINLSTYGN